MHSKNSFKKTLAKAAKLGFRVMSNVKNTKQGCTRKGRGIAVYLDVKGS